MVVREGGEDVENVEARVAKLKRRAMFSFGCTATVTGNIPLTHAVDARRFYGSILQVALPPVPVPPTFSLPFVTLYTLHRYLSFGR